MTAFLSTPSARRTTIWTPLTAPRRTNFYPRPPRGGRRNCLHNGYKEALFLSTPSARRATSIYIWIVNTFSISIHALREEGDVSCCACIRISSAFLSTPSARRATPAICVKMGHFCISIHALREEGDQHVRDAQTGAHTFLSTPSARRATDGHTGDHLSRVISIHALREEGDGQPAPTAGLSERNFYPRPPRGGRRSVRAPRETAERISIHALREEGDRVLAHTVLQTQTFLSTPSARRATGTATPENIRQEYFYPRPPRGGRPERGCKNGTHQHYFYPRPPRGGRQQKQRENPLLLSHYTPPCTNCKEVPVKQTAKSHRYLCKRLVFRCEASGKTMCAACPHWRGIKRSAHYPAQTPGAAQHARP